MHARASGADRRFRDRFESGEVSPDEFDHRAHLRLAYTCLCENRVPAALARMRSALRRFLAHHSIDPSRYHETLTRAWMAAVRHFMELAGSPRSFDELVASDRRLLDQRIMLTHYTQAVLFSPEARAAYVAPDVDPIPAYER